MSNSEKNNDFNDKKQSLINDARELIEKNGLEMKIVELELSEDNKYIFNFTAENRVDFRDLVRQLASKLKRRIELRQIGTRDECRLVGGLAMCGRAFCCCSSNKKGDYPQVSIKMAKNQSLSLNPTKISGACGRLMCCISHENETYKDINNKMPKMGSLVKTADGKEGTVTKIMHLKDQVRLKIVDRDSFAFNDYHTNDLVFKRQPNTQNNNSKKNDDEDEDE